MSAGWDFFARPARVMSSVNGRPDGTCNASATAEASEVRRLMSSILAMLVSSFPQAQPRSLGVKPRISMGLEGDGEEEEGVGWGSEVREGLLSHHRPEE